VSRFFAAIADRMVLVLAPVPADDGAKLAMLELVGSELVKRAVERAKRKEGRLKAQREGRESEAGEEEESKE
jgi:hypothetical protein